MRVGDGIETSSVAGVVTDVGLFATDVHRADGVYAFVANSNLWNKPVAIFSTAADADDRALKKAS